MTTAVAAPAATLQSRFQDIADFLDRYSVERKEETQLLLLATISGVDLLFLGEPGVGKTWQIELLTDYALTDMMLFTHLLAKDQSVAELLGEKDVMALKRGESARIMTGMLPMCNFAYLDEIFKGSPPMLNPMLDVFAKRQLKIGGKVIDCSQLITIVMSSNELPDREDLQAFRDRIAITKFVEPVRTPDGRRAVSLIQLGYDLNGIDTIGLDPLGLGEIQAIRQQARKVQVPAAIVEMMGDIEQRCMEAGHPISQRRKRDIWRMVKSRAWVRGSDTVQADDFLVAQHMTWNHPDHRESARAIILDFASVFTRKAARLRDAMEPVLAELQELKAKIDAADEADKIDLMDGGFKFLRQLQKLKKDGQAQVREGREQGQDTSMIEDVIGEIAKAANWATTALSGVEEEDES